MLTLHLPGFMLLSSPLILFSSSLLWLLLLCGCITLTNAYTKSSCTDNTDTLISPVVKTQNFQMWDSRCNFLVNFTISDGQLIFYQYQSYSLANVIWSAEWTDGAATAPFSFQLLEDTFLILDSTNRPVYDASASDEWLNRVSGGTPISLAVTVTRELVLKDKNGKILWITDTTSTPGPSRRPTRHPILPGQPSPAPSLEPTLRPTLSPTLRPSKHPTTHPTERPTLHPTIPPTGRPTTHPTLRPTVTPTQLPTTPTLTPTFQPTSSPTAKEETQVISGIKNLYFFGGISLLVLSLIFGTYIYCRCCKNRRRRRRKRRHSKRRAKKEEIEVA